MSAFKGLKLTPTIPDKSVDPVAKRRIGIVKKLEDQHKLSLDANYLRRETKFRGKGEARESYTQEKRVRPWWRPTSDGNVVFAVYVSGRPVELAKGMYGITTTKDDLPGAIEKCIQAVTTGELDVAITAAASKPTKKVPTRKAA
jgi:hypothetical protein